MSPLYERGGILPAMREAVVRRLGQDRAALLGALGHVSGEQWDRPTVCDGWRVKDVLAHLVEGELLAGSVYRGETRELGTVDPDGGIAKWTALPGEAVRAAFWQHGTAAQRILERMTDDAWEAPIDVLGCHRVAQLARLHLFEVVVHGHDILSALGVPPIWAQAMPFLVEFVVRAAPATLSRRGLAPDAALEVTADGSTWTIDGRSGRWAVTEPATATELRAPAAVELPGDRLVLATTGRLPVEEALVGARIAGDTGVVERMLRGWQILAP